VIVLAGSLPVPDLRFQQQLAIGGRLFAVMGSGLIMEARLVERVAADQWRSTALFETAIQPLVGAPVAEQFRF
jgi:protein-L-isoaspartate(D-aspartate) O-methyltransferase